MSSRDCSSELQTAKEGIATITQAARLVVYPKHRKVEERLYGLGLICFSHFLFFFIERARVAFRGEGKPLKPLHRKVTKRLSRLRVGPIIVSSHSLFPKVRTENCFRAIKLRAFGSE